MKKRKKRIMISIPEDVLDAITLQVDGVEIKSVSHLIEILCTREASQTTKRRTEAHKRMIARAPVLQAFRAAAFVNPNLTNGRLVQVDQVKGLKKTSGKPSKKRRA